MIAAVRFVVGLITLIVAIVVATLIGIVTGVLLLGAGLLNQIRQRVATQKPPAPRKSAVSLKYVDHEGRTRWKH